MSTKGLAWACASLIGASGAVSSGQSASEPAVKGAGPETQRVIAGRPGYDRSSYFKFHFGEGYRKLWTTEFPAPVLDLRTFAAGLTPIRQVGSMQSIGLALKGADGRSYTFRTLDKDPTKILPAEWRESFPAALFQDQTTASHPGSAFIVPPLAEAAGVPHTSPLVVFMPDDPTLGTFRRPSAAGPGPSTSTRRRPAPAPPGSRERSRSSPRASSGSGGRKERGRSTRRPSCARGSSTCSSATGTATTASGGG